MPYHLTPFEAHEVKTDFLSLGNLCTFLSAFFDIAGKQIKRGSVTRQQELLDEECACKMCPAQPSSVQHKVYACEVVG